MCDEAAAVAIRRAFIDPIRSVLLVDDRFPTYADLNPNRDAQGERPADPVHPDVQVAAAPADEHAAVRRDWEQDTALGLWREFAARGWVCDVENSHFENVERLKGADLVVLDYRLAHDTTSLSLELLKKLADTDFERMVILYTKDDDLQDVCRRVVGRLRGAKNPQPILAQLAKELAADDVDELADSIDDDAAGHLDESMLDRYLVGDERGATTSLGQSVPARYSRALRPLCAYLCERKLADDYGALTTAEIRRVVFEAGDRPWVVCGNLFIAVAKKGLQPAKLVELLEAALRAWSPTPLRLCAAYARAAMSRRGLGGMGAIARYLPLEVGLTDFILTEGPKRGPRLLFEHGWEALGHSLIDDVTGFAEGLLRPDGGDNLARAKKVCRAPSQDHAVIYLRLNAFLCSEPAPTTRLRTGTILQDMGDDNIVWVCVTPPCDLDPREPKSGSWNARLKPFREVRLRRAEFTSAAAAIAKPTDLHHVFWGYEEAEPKCATVKDVRLETVLVEKDGLIEDGSVSFFRVHAQDGVLTMTHRALRVVGQLRDQNASLLLQQVGVESSRIGVDFVNKK